MVINWNGNAPQSAYTTDVTSINAVTVQLLSKTSVVTNTKYSIVPQVAPRPKVGQLYPRTI